MTRKEFDAVKWERGMNAKYTDDKGREKTRKIVCVLFDLEGVHVEGDGVFLRFIHRSKIIEIPRRATCKK